MQTAEQLSRHFETWGFVAAPGAVRDEIDEIQAEFESIFRERGGTDTQQSASLYPLLDQRERLSMLIEHPAISGLAEALFGRNFLYLGSDGNLYHGDTEWHCDSVLPNLQLVKLALYLDPVREATGALRVIPGSYRGGIRAGEDPVRLTTEDTWGVRPEQVPSHVLESDPGDVVAFDFKTFHASFGGGSRRRMMSIVVAPEPETAAEEDALQHWLVYHQRFLAGNRHTQIPSQLMLDTASPERLRHIEPVAERDARLRALSDGEFERLVEPARRAVLGQVGVSETSDAG